MPPFAWRRPTPWAGTAHADTAVCAQFGSTTINGGRYVVQSNNWGDTSQQCINVTATGFSITSARHNKPQNNGSIYDASYDIWFDPTPRTTGQNTGAELMIWLNRTGSVQPIGSRVATVSLAGGAWDVWFGNVGWNVISYVRTSAASSISFPMTTFWNDVVSRGYGQTSWYLTSVQAGFEPWVNGVGLGVTNFSYSIGGSGGGGGGGTGSRITGIGGKCVDVAGAGTANGTKIQLWTCNGSAAQRWTVGADGTIRALGKCMDVTGAGTADGTRVQLYDCNATNAQRWSRSGTQLVNTGSGKCLDATIS